MNGPQMKVDRIVANKAVETKDYAMKAHQPHQPGGVGGISALTRHSGGVRCRNVISAQDAITQTNENHNYEE